MRSMNPGNSLHPWHDVLTRAAPGDHLAQTYRDSGFVAEAVGLFLGVGLQRGDPAIVISTKHHWKLTQAFLNDGGIDVAKARESGQLLILEAEEMLSRFLVGGMPDRGMFQKEVGRLICDVQKRAPRYSGLRAYGEMVDLLWQRKTLPAAIRLEEYWNELAKTTPFSLLCSYFMDPEDEEIRNGPLQSVRQTHSHLGLH